ncbi:uncharacterized protein [Chironomus tepperi]|uniref:uncharacterized protein n=1 Tax=Chironomus tepperi TaxID=113505 RepID=UPI00391F5085
MESYTVKIRQCNYCKNHLNKGDPPVPYSGHGHCPYNNEIHIEGCDPCKKNLKNTKRMQEYRAKQCPDVPSKKIKYVIVPDNKIIYDETQQDLQTSINNPQNNGSPQNGDVVMYVIPPGYPNSKTDQEKDKILDLLENAPSGSHNPRIKYSTFENGYLKVCCCDEITSNWLVNQVKSWPWIIDNIEKRGAFKVFSNDEAPNGLRVIILFCVQQIISREEFLISQPIYKKNCWVVKVCNQFDGKTEFIVSIDQESYVSIWQNGFKLNVKGENVIVNVLEDPLQKHLANPAAVTNESADIRIYDVIHNSGMWSTDRLIVDGINNSDISDMRLGKS